MSNELKIKLYGYTIDCKQPQELAKFYTELLGWVQPYQDDDYAVVAPPGVAQGAYPGITIQRDPDYLPPVWPAEPEAQQQMAHIDFAVNDLDKAVARAVECGAKVAEAQFSDGWKVMLDPAGHPFCLCLMQQIFEAE